MGKQDFVYERCFSRNNINEAKITKLIDNNLVIWGTAVTANILYSIVTSWGISPKFFLDSNDAVKERDFHGIKILTPKQYRESYQAPDDIIVMGMREAIALEVKKEVYSSFSSIYTIQELLRYIHHDFSILEIGPSSSPFFVGPNVKYFDVFGPEELKKEAIRYHRSPDGVPEVIDYISPNGDWNCVGDGIFSYIYSSHLIEHQPDLVYHLQNVERHLKPKGEYLLTIPDKRYCFNYYQPETTTSDILLAYHEKYRTHSLRAWLYTLMPAHNDAARHWRDDHGEKPTISLQAYEKVISDYNVALSGNKYVDMHEWYFTPDGFVDICNNLQAMNLIDLKVETCNPTERESIEFYVALKKES